MVAENLVGSCVYQSSPTNQFSAVSLRVYPPTPVGLTFVTVNARDGGSRDGGGGCGGESTGDVNEAAVHQGGWGG